MKKHMKIGFIGLGIMGSRMAANLQKAGYNLVVHNRTHSKADDLIEGGATWANTPAAVASQVEILITMLAHPEAVEMAALGEDGFLDALPEGALWIDDSTVDPAFSRRMGTAANTRRVRMLDAPVAGSKIQAQEAKLAFVVGGDPADIEVAKPLFEVMGAKIIPAGPQGMGASLKIVVNQLLAVSMAAFAEGVAFGESMGIPKETLLKVLIGGPVVPPFMAGKKEKLMTGEFDTEFPLRWMQKDVHLAALTAYGTGVAMPIANATKEAYQQAVKQGYGDEDFSAVYKLFSS